MFHPPPRQHPRPRVSFEFGSCLVIIWFVYEQEMSRLLVEKENSAASRKYYNEKADSRKEGLPGEPTTKNKVSIEHLLNSSPPRQSWSEVSIRKKGGPLAFLESLSANANVAVAQKRNNAVTNFIVMPL